MTDGSTGPNKGLDLAKLRAEAGGGRRWLRPKVLLALLLVASAAGLAAFVMLRGKEETSFGKSARLLKESRRHLKAERYREALISAEAAARISGSTAQPYLLQAQALFHLGNNSEAIERCRTALSVEPEDDNARLFLARYFARTDVQAWGECRRLVREVLDSGRPNKLILGEVLQLGLGAAVQLGLLDEAIEYGNVLVDNLKSARPCLTQAKLLQKRFMVSGSPTDVDRARELLVLAEVRAKQALNLKRNNPELQALLARIYAEQAQAVPMVAASPDGDESSERSLALARRQEKYLQALDVIDRSLLGTKSGAVRPVERILLKVQILLALERRDEATDLLGAEFDNLERLAGGADANRSEAEVLAIENRWRLLLAQGSLKLQSEDPGQIEEAKKVAERGRDLFARMEFQRLLSDAETAMGNAEAAEAALLEGARMDEQAGRSAGEWHALIRAKQLRDGDVEKFEKECLEAIRNKPEDLSAHVQLLDVVEGPRFIKGLDELSRATAASRVERTGAVESARTALEGRIESIESLSPDRVAVRFWQSVLLRSSGRLREAVKLLERVVEVAPNYVQAWDALGQARQRLGNVPGAIKAYQGLLAAERRTQPDDPPSARSQLLLLTAYSVSERHEEAVRFGKSAAEEHPDNRMIRFQYGVALLRKQDPVAAEAQFREIVRSNEDWGVGYAMLGQALYLRGSREDAQNAFTTAIRIDDTVSTRRILAEFFVGQNDRARALDEYRRMVKRFPDDPWAHNLMGAFYGRVGNLDKALEAYENGIAVDPEYLANYGGAGRVSLARRPLTAESIARAEGYANGITARSPRNLEGQLLAGRVLLARRETREAVEACEAILADRDSVEARYLLALALYSLPDADLDRVRGHLEAVLESNPANGGARRLLSELMVKQAIARMQSTGNVEDANRALSTASELDPKNIRGRVLLADTYLGLSRDDPAKMDLAIREARKLVEDEPESFQAHAVLGSILSRKAQDENSEPHLLEAERHLRKAVALAPIGVTHLSLGQHLLATKQYPEARKSFGAALSTEKKALNAFFGIVVSYFAEENWAAAEKLCRDRLADPGTPDGLGLVRLWLGQALARQEKLSEALAAYRAAVRANPKLDGAGQQAVLLVLREQDPTAALKEVDALIELAPEVPSYHTLRGSVLIRAERYPEAREAFEEAMGLKPGNAQDYIGLSRAYALAGEGKACVAHFEKLVKANPHDPIVQMLLGTSCERIGEITKAEAAYRKVLELDPANWQAANNLAWILAWHREKPAFALKHALDASRKQPDNANVADTLAWIYICQGEKDSYELALDLLVKHEKTLSDDVNYQFHRAKALQGLERKEQADAWLLRAENGIDDYSLAGDRLRQGIRDLRVVVPRQQREQPEDDESRTSR